MTTSPNPFANVPPPAPLRVVVADDNPVVRAGLTALLTGREDITVVAEAADGARPTRRPTPTVPTWSCWTSVCPVWTASRHFRTWYGSLRW